MSPAIPRRLRDDVPRDEYPEKLINLISEKLGEDADTSKRIISAAISGRETKNSESAIEHWIESQLIPNTILIDQAGYTEMCIDALKTISTQVLTDFGSSRQRDFGQAWSDTIRGYLGEYAVVKFLELNFGIKTKLAHQRGFAEDFYNSDIAEVLDKDTWRAPHINIGIKTAKFNGLWLDVPKEQFSKADIHVQVKIGGGTTHLFSFFKELSVFKDKILKAGLDGKYLTQSESEQIWNDIPPFKPVAAYITGFAIRDLDYSQMSYEGHLAIVKYTIHTFSGLLQKDYIETIKKREGLTAKQTVEFESIGKFTAHDRFVFNTGSINRTKNEWESFINRL